MVRHQNTLWCDGCGVEITWEPIEKERLFFCCENCQDGEDCHCAEQDLEYPQEYPSKLNTNYSSSY